MSSVGAATQRLMTEYKDLAKEPWCNIDMRDDSVFRWDIGLMVMTPDSPYHGGYLKAEMTFSNSYPYSPPSFRFTKPLYHPNIYADGRVCISILHPPGDDVMAGEVAEERWSPLQGVRSVLLSVLLLLDNAEINSPANVDASVMYRDDRPAFIERVKQDVERSKADIPAGFIMPTGEEEAPQSKIMDDDDFWAASDEEDFGGSDSDADMNEFDEEDDEEESAEDDAEQ